MIERVFRGINILVVGLGFYLLFVLVFSQTKVDYDLWGYLAFGRIFWEDHYFPYRDVVAYTPTLTRWIYHEWLTGVLFYPILKYLGPAGIQLTRYVVIVLTLYIVYLTALKKGAKPALTFVCLSLAIVLLSFGYAAVARAQIFTYLFFISTIYLIETARKDKRWKVLLWILPLQVIWCNFHGGFVAGLGIIALYAAGDFLSGRKFAPLAAIFVPAALVTLINPYGLEYWKYTIAAVSMPRPEVHEWFSVWRSLEVHYMVDYIVIFIPLSLAGLALLVLRGRQSITETLIAAATIYLGASHVRHIVFFALIFGAFAPAALQKLWERLSEKMSFPAAPPWLPPLLLAAFFISVNVLGDKTIGRNQHPMAPSFYIAAPANLYPVGALHWMKEHHFQGNILPVFQWGEYLILSCSPGCRVAMDGRYETIYPEQVNREYFDFLLGREGWQVFLDKYPHDAVLLQTNTKVHHLMLREPHWTLAYADRFSVLFLKNMKKNASS